MKTSLLCLIAVCLMIGCGKRAPATPNSEAAKAPGGDKVSIEGLGQPAADQPPAPPPPPAPDGTEAAATPPGEAPPGLDELTMAVRSYVMSQGKPPGSMEDLAKAGAIRKMPTPPAGKEYVLAPDKMSVRLVDR
jgi:hypothetical protein